MRAVFYAGIPLALLSQKRFLQLANFFLALLFVAGSVIVAIALGSLLRTYTENAIALTTISLCSGALAMTFAGLAFYPGATWGSLGLRLGSASGGLYGLLIGAGACGSLVCAAVLCGLGEWTSLDASEIRFDWRDARLAGVSLLCIGAAAEELLLRGLALQLLACAVRPAGAIALTSVAFAVLHGANPGITWLAHTNTALFGAVFGLAVFRQRSLWVAIGLHLGWNLTQVALGADTSGITIRLTELNLELQGREWLTGGDYGLEGGVLASVAALLVATAVWRLPSRRPSGSMLWDSEGIWVPPGRDLVPGGPVGMAGGNRSADGPSEDRTADARPAQ